MITPSHIIYILADDLGYADLSFNGQEKYATPNIDKLACNGTIFTQHYAGSTVCAPSRSSLLTGQHTGHTYTRANRQTNPDGQHPLEDKAVTIAEILKQAGYVTSVFGKWGLGSPESSGDPLNQGFNKFFGYYCQRLAHSYYPHYLYGNTKKVIIPENADRKTAVYAPDLIHEKAMSFLEQHKDTTFFMYYPSVMPHAELAAPEKYMEKFRGKFLPEKIYISEEKDTIPKNWELLQ